MNITTYLNDLVNEFLTINNYNYNFKIGFDKTIIDFKSFNKFPIVIVEDIQLSLDPNYLSKLVGSLNFSLMFFVYKTNGNGYSIIEEQFITKFNEFIISKDDLTINELTFDTDNDNVYLVNYSLTNNCFELN